MFHSRCACAPALAVVVLIGASPRVWAVSGNACAQTEEGICDDAVGFAQMMVQFQTKQTQATNTLKLINAGLPRTGTESLHEALSILGYKNNWHGECNPPTECQRATCEYSLGHEPFDILAKHLLAQNVSAVNDEPLCMFYKELANYFPESKVVLLVRDSAEEWYKSFEHMQDLQFGSDRIRKIQDLPYWIMCDQLQHTRFNCDIYSANPPEQIRRGCIDGYNQHIQKVKAAIPAERLLVFNVKEGWGPLCEFLDLPVPEVPFPFNNDYMQHLERTHPSTN